MILKRMRKIFKFSKIIFDRQFLCALYKGAAAGIEHIQIIPYFYNDISLINYVYSCLVNRIVTNQGTILHQIYRE